MSGQNSISQETSDRNFRDLKLFRHLSDPERKAETDSSPGGEEQPQKVTENRGAGNPQQRVLVRWNPETNQSDTETSPEAKEGESLVWKRAKLKESVSRDTDQNIQQWEDTDTAEKGRNEPSNDSRSSRWLWAGGEWAEPRIFALFEINLISGLKRFHTEIKTLSFVLNQLMLQALCVE